MKETYTKPMMDIEEFSTVDIHTSVVDPIEPLPGEDD